MSQISKTHSQYYYRIIFVSFLVTFSAFCTVLFLIAYRFSPHPHLTQISPLHVEANKQSTKTKNSLYYGVNIDMSQLLPGSPNYITNAKGEDATTIARHLGINLFRITNVLNTGKTAVYSKEQWNYVLQNMQKHGIKALILVEAKTSEANFASDTIGPWYLQLVNEYILTSGVADNPDVIGIDLKNEPRLTSNNLQYLKNAAALIKKNYPHAQVTVGGWKKPEESNSDVWNTPADGKLLANIVDFYAVHIYHFDKKVNGTLPDPYRLTHEYLSRVKKFSGNKPVLIEEFGAGNGDAVTDQDTIGNPQLQANAYDGVYRAVNSIVDGKLMGSVAYLFLQRGTDIDAWPITKNNGNYLFPAAYVLQKYATGKSDVPLPLPFTHIPNDYLLDNSNNKQTKVVMQDAIIGVNLSLDPTATYDVMISGDPIFLQTQPLTYVTAENTYQAVFHLTNRGKGAITVKQINPANTVFEVNLEVK